jgi:NAD(P)-dependent dehydrogenase (short-subunit alcohol dehydrogenase family)
VTEVLRAGVLEGVGVTVAPVAPPGRFGDAVLARVEALGAVAGSGTLVVDASGAAEPRAALDGAWDLVRPAAGAMIAHGGGGQILLLAPPPGDAHAAAARAGLENLARTLSVEWARYAIRPVTILPGAATSPAEVAELVAFLASPAGGYYAGCAFTLGSATA